MTEHFQQRFANWVRWCIAKGLPQGHALSLEGQYRSPQHWWPEGPRPPSIDLVDAVMVNRAYSRLMFLAPKQARVIKLLTFKPYLRPQWQAQKLGIHYLDLGEAYYQAKLMLRNQLDFLEKKVYKEEVVGKLIMAPAIYA
jgi:hypothetical protein